MCRQADSIMFAFPPKSKKVLHTQDEPGEGWSAVYFHFKIFKDALKERLKKQMSLLSERAVTHPSRPAA